MTNRLGVLAWRVREKAAWLRASKRERRHALVGPVQLWQAKRDFQIRFLKQRGLEPKHYLGDIGCGTLRGGIPIIEYLAEGHYYGIERDAEVLEQGRRELEEAALDPKRPSLVATDDVGSLDLGRRFHFLWAFSVLIHMSDKVLERCLHFVDRHLEPSGSLYANVNIGERPDDAWRGLPIVWRSHEFYERAALEHGLRADDLGDLRSLGHAVGNRSDSQRMLRFSKASP